MSYFLSVSRSVNLHSFNPSQDAETDNCLHVKGPDYLMNCSLNKVFDWSKFKAIAEDKINCNEIS